MPLFNLKNMFNFFKITPLQLLIRKRASALSIISKMQNQLAKINSKICVEIGRAEENLKKQQEDLDGLKALEKQNSSQIKKFNNLLDDE